MSTTIDVDIELECAYCGGNLEADYRRGVVRVEICQYCISQAKEEGIAEGREEASK